WEDFATPSRDMRLLIAIDVVRAFPEAVLRRRDHYAIPAGKSPDDVRHDLDLLLQEELGKRTFSYTRSNGSSFTLTLNDIVARASAFEAGYNPNDCVETRWGAPPGSREASTCARKAPAEQRARMQEYRGWFRDRHRPPRA